MNNKIVIDENTGKPNLYIEIKNMRSINSVARMMRSRKMSYLGDNHGHFSSASTMVSELQKYEKTKERNFGNSTYEARFGELITIMLPRVSRSWANKTLLNIAKKVISFIVGEEKTLGWIVFSMRRMNTVFLKIWISDRAYYDYYRVKTYNRNIFVDRNTNKFCKSTAENAVLAHKKGDVILDEYGTPVKENAKFYPRKTRIFCFASETAFVNFCNQLKSKILGILTSLRGDIRVVKEMVIRRKKLTRIWNRHIRLITSLNNRARAYVQDGFNLAKAEIAAMFPEKMSQPEFGNEPSPHVLPKEISDALKSLLDKYTSIFKNDAFEYNGVLLRLFGGAPSLVEETCNLLMQVFDSDISAIRTAAAGMIAC